MTGAIRKKLVFCYPYIVAALTVLLCLAVWPLGLFGHTTYKSTSLEEGIFPNLNLSDGSIVTGEFTPRHSRLTAISFRYLISGDAPDGEVSLELCDQAGKTVCTVTLESGDIMNYRWCRFPVDAVLEAGETYTWHMKASEYEDTPLALYSGSPVIGPQEAGKFYYNGAPDETRTPAAVYTYTDRIDGEHYLPWYAAFAILGVLLTVMCRKFETPDEEA